jgi:hypothetical protein
LTKHLGLVIRMFSQKFFTIRNFAFRIVIQNWKERKIQYIVEA